MIKKYKNRPVAQIEEAIRFKYTEKGIQELKDFCGLAFLYCDKSRHIMAMGKAQIEVDGVKKTLLEGDFISRTAIGNLLIIDHDYFINVYEEVE